MRQTTGGGTGSGPVANASEAPKPNTMAQETPNIALRSLVNERLMTSSGCEGQHACAAYASTLSAILLDGDDHVFGRHPLTDQGWEDRRARYRACAGDGRRLSHTLSTSTRRMGKAGSDGSRVRGPSCRSTSSQVVSTGSLGGARPRSVGTELPPFLLRKYVPDETRTGGVKLVMTRAASRRRCSCHPPHSSPSRPGIPTGIARRGTAQQPWDRRSAARSRESRTPE